MFRLTLKNSLRHFVRNRLFTFLNILGLTIGISACWVIYRYVRFELSYERGLPDKENIHRVVSKISYSEEEGSYSAGISRPIYFFLKEEPVRSLKRAVPVYKIWGRQVMIPAHGKQAGRLEDLDFEKNMLVATEPAYFEMVNYRWLAGNQHQALRNPDEVVLTEARARFYYPGLTFDEMIGQPLIYEDSLQHTITGVVAALDYPSEFNGQEFFLVKKREQDNTLEEWTNTNSSDRVYIQTKDDKAAAEVLEQINSTVAAKYKQLTAKRELKGTYHRTLELLPLQASHFSTFLNERGQSKTSRTVIFGLIGVGVFLLVLACINYVNLTTAQMPQRHKEIGIRKTLGSAGRHLISQLMMETVVVVLASFLCSIVVSQVGVGLLGDLMSEESRAFADPETLVIFLVAVLLVTTFLAGMYPAWLITRVNAVAIFRNKASGRVGNLSLRKILIVFQFVIAQVFIVSALIVGQQLRYTLQKDMGFNKDAVVTVAIPFKLYANPQVHEKKITLANEFRNIPGVKELAMGTEPLSENYSSSNFVYSDAPNLAPVGMQVFKKYVDTAYVQFYDLKLLAGTNLSASDTTKEFVLNETAVRAFGFKNPGDAVGKMLGYMGRRYPVVGVVSDFHQQDFHQAIQPLTLLSGKTSLSAYNIRLDGSDRAGWPATLAALKTTWGTFFPEEMFSYHFYDESIAAMYKKEQQLHKLTNLSTGIAVVISCLGLFGLASLTAFQRSKEIGIRKVLGASVPGIVRMLSGEFVMMVLLAALIAAPVVWWACNKWLEDFVYRIEISWAPFVLGGVVAVLAALSTVSYQGIKAAMTNPVESLRND
ncbi:ABC transporter permease [Ravibacter arvi]